VLSLALPIKFIHTADIHLGSMLNISNDAAVKENDILKDAIFSAFRKIIDYAIFYNVDFLLISGDLYDKDAISIKANNFFFHQCERLLTNNIKVFIIGGNHDAFIIKRELFKMPPNVFLCESEKLSEFDVLDENSNIIARVCGESYRGKGDSRKMYNAYNPPSDGIFNIGMLHTELNPNSLNYVPCTLTNLKSNNNIDYWALGHIHKCGMVNEEKPTVVFSGIPQGRDVGETGIGGCIFVKVDDTRKIELEFLPTSSVIWDKIEININENGDKTPENLTELIELISNRAKSLKHTFSVIPKGFKNNEDLSEIVKGYVIRWVITGRGNLKNIFEDSSDDISEVICEELNLRFMQDDVFVLTDSIDVRIENPVTDYRKFLENNGTIKKLYELCEGARHEGKFRSALIESFGQAWEKNYDSENLNNLKAQLDQDAFDKILNEAKELIVMKFIKENR